MQTCFEIVRKTYICVESPCNLVERSVLALVIDSSYKGDKEKSSLKLVEKVCSIGRRAFLVRMVFCSKAANEFAAFVQNFNSISGDYISTFLAIFGRQAAKVLLKTGSKIRRCIEAYKRADFRHGVATLFQQFACFVESYLTNELIR